MCIKKLEEEVVMRRKRIRKRKLRRFRNRFASRIWSRVFATVYDLAFGRALSGDNVQMALARGPTYRI